MREVNERIRDAITRFHVVTGTYDVFCECPGQCLLSMPRGTNLDLRRAPQYEQTYLVVVASLPPVDQAAQQQARVA